MYEIQEVCLAWEEMFGHLYEVITSGPFAIFCFILSLIFLGLAIAFDKNKEYELSESFFLTALRMLCVNALVAICWLARKLC